jgi:prophage regulatory protein
MGTAPLDSDKFISPSVVQDRTSLSRVTLWRLSRSGKFPSPIQISPGRVAWSDKAVREWMTSKLEAAH